MILNSWSAKCSNSEHLYCLCFAIIPELTCLFTVPLLSFGFIVKITLLYLRFEHYHSKPQSPFIQTHTYPSYCSPPFLISCPYKYSFHLTSERLRNCCLRSLFSSAFTPARNAEIALFCQVSVFCCLDLALGARPGRTAKPGYTSFSWFSSCFSTLLYAQSLSPTLTLFFPSRSSQLTAMMKMNVNEQCTTYIHHLTGCPQTSWASCMCSAALLSQKCG